MSSIAFILALMFLARHYGGGGSLSPASLATEAAHAAIDAHAKTERAKQTGHPAHAAEAAAAQQKAAVLTNAAQKTAAAAERPAPWPQAMPTGLPPFPSGWEFDQPPPQAVQDRAWQLLPQLWKQGANARKTEKTAGRWITYVAQQMGTKRGVVAYRPRPGAAAAPASSPATNVATYAQPSSSTPTLGLNSPYTDAVQRWQRIIGVTADGKFGPATLAATKQWQAAHGLTADGIVGRQTWAAAGGTPV